MWRANLCSRVGNRVLITVAEFPAPDKRALYEGAKRVHWSEWFRHDQTFAVDASTLKSKLNHHGFARSYSKMQSAIDSDTKDTSDRMSIASVLMCGLTCISKMIEPRSVWMRVVDDCTTVATAKPGEAPVKETLAAACALDSMEGPKHPWSTQCAAQGHFSLRLP